MFLRGVAAVLLAAMAFAQERAAPAAITAGTASRTDALATTKIFWLQDSAIWTCDGNGEHARRWSPVGVQMPAALSLSPDGRSFAIASAHLLLLREEGNFVDLGAITPWGSHPAWSTDGKSIALGSYAKAAGEGGIWMVDDVAARSEVRPFTPPNVFEDNPEFSPDGHWLALVATLSMEIKQQADVILVERKSRVEIVDRATGKHTVACERMGAIDDLAWSPDGRDLAFEMDGELFVVAMAGGVAGPVRTLAKNVRRGGPMVWSPDSKILLVDRGVGTKGDGREDALVLVPMHGDATQIRLHRSVVDAAFGPSGEWIVAACGDCGLCRVHVPTQRVESLRDGSDYRSPVWWRQ